jgi:DNA invertase Pin-like site-specific DNA recombinase
VLSRLLARRLQVGYVIASPWPSPEHLASVFRENNLRSLTGRASFHLNRLTSYGVGYRSFTEQYFDSCGIFKDAVIAIIATVAKQERVRISLRVRAGLEVARARGARIGRPPRTQLSMETRIAIADCYANEKTSLRALAKRFGTSLATVQRCVGIRQSAVSEGHYPA